jgi:hypothetical protein
MLATLRVGATFTNKDEVIMALHQYDTTLKLKSTCKRSQPDYVLAICKIEGCGFHLTVGKSNGRLKVKKLHHHTCEPDDHTNFRFGNNVNFLARKTQDLIVRAENVSIATLQADAGRSVDHAVPYQQMYRAKTRVMDRIYGDKAASFQQLPDLLIAYQDQAPNTVSEIEWDEGNKFVRMFLSHGSWVSAFSSWKSIAFWMHATCPEVLISVCCWWPWAKTAMEKLCLLRSAFVQLKMGEIGSGFASC